MRRCVIIGGAKIADYEFVKKYLKQDDYVIYCDSGLKHMDALGLEASLVIGDFDSYKGERPQVETIILPCVKDDTDTVFAAKEAVKRGFEEVLLLGVIGGRFDHSMANVSLMLDLHNNGINAKALYDCSEFGILGQTPVTIKDDCKYFSLVSVFGEASDVTIKNAKYELESGTVKPDYQYAVSNEPIKGKTAEASVGKGTLLLVKVFEEI